MHIKLGQKIRELRRRDGRTQEELAAALRVTAQAVSRWELDGGYPDTEILPVLANYFHVTIDELFGYNGDREEKIAKILTRTHEDITSHRNLSECIALLREAAEEFPSEGRILMQLGDALFTYGCQQHGSMMYIKKGEEFANDDIEYNLKNPYWQEALEIFEHLLAADLLSVEDREPAIPWMVIYYAKMGEHEKAKALCEKQSSIGFSRQCLLPKATAGEERSKYQGEAILALLQELHEVMIDSFATRRSLSGTDKGIKLRLLLANFYETIFEDGNCGHAHLWLWDLYQAITLCKAQRGDTEDAMHYFEKAFYHRKAYNSIYCMDVYHYTAPLVAHVSLPGACFPPLSDGVFRKWMEILPNSLLERIKSDERYAECFSEG